MNFSVLTVAQPVQQAVEAKLESRRFDLPMSEEPLAQHPTPLTPASDAVTTPADTNAWGTEHDRTAVSHRNLTIQEILRYIWYSGIVGMGVFFLVSNLRFWQRLRKYRTPYTVEGYNRPIYLVGEGVLPSPCLYGLFRPAIYLTPAALASEDTLSHVLTHEETHARHLDPLWSLLRCVCLAVYWFDPLVWLAAFASKTDCELACDESVLAQLGERERIPYGRTLCSLIPVRKEPFRLLLTATTMTAGKRQIKDRLSRIARRPKRFLAGTLAVTTLASVLAACTFTAGTTPDQDAANGPTALTGEELRWFNEVFFNSAAGKAAGSGIHASYGDGTEEFYNLRNQFANPVNLYNRPEDIDLYELFYLEGDCPTDREIRDYLGIEPSNLVCPAYKMTLEEMDTLLQTYTGIPLSEGNQMSIKKFLYQESGPATGCTATPITPANSPSSAAQSRPLTPVSW